ncbi:MAG: Rieske (2Fe-2S) protein [Proteobacteria bacterium]|nr:Rieske (2Fe-2S) protein [Desulfobulbaceae bacterium]MBU4151252.1 Rieske (2Fe-2S) protein [Pseudomonadota bacterium]
MPQPPPVTSGSKIFATSRRRFLRQGLGWLILTAMTYPLFRFLNFRLPKKPIQIKIDKDLSLRGFAIERDFILFRGEDTAWAVSRRCTHLGCTLSYDETAHQLVCPCHHSRFDTEGKRLAGPAQRDLSIYPVEKAPEGSKGYIVTL